MSLYFDNEKLFDAEGHLTDEGLYALKDGTLDDLGALEAAEHLSYCDKCMDRYTALLTADALETPPRSVQGAVMGTIWARLMQNITRFRAHCMQLNALFKLAFASAPDLKSLTLLHTIARRTVLQKVPYHTLTCSRCL